MRRVDQMTQVLTDYPRKDLEVGQVHLRFFLKRFVSQTPRRGRAEPGAIERQARPRLRLLISSATPREQEVCLAPGKRVPRS